jgi:murein DD-endopeptidase MepM/ murein hydrolase activator NlpD
MPKTKYKYNPTNLSFEEVSLSIWKRFFKLLLWVAPSIIVGLILSLIFTKQVDSPKDVQLLKDLEVNQIELSRIKKDMDLASAVLDVLEKRDEDLYRVSLYAEKMPQELNLAGSVKSSKYGYLDGYTNAELLKSTSEKLDHLEKRISNQSISFIELLNLAKQKEKMLSSIPAIQPIRNKELKKMASGYGYRIDPIYKTRKMHTGMDFTADIGTEVYVTGDGVVEDLEVNVWGYGNCVVVNHSFGFKTRYAHLSAFKVQKGQIIKRGEIIGLVGTSGKSTGPHLHYEVEKNSSKVNPINYYHSDLTPQEYETLLQMNNNSFKALD